MNLLEHLAVSLKGMKEGVKYRRILSTGELSKVVIWWQYRKDNPKKRGYFLLPDGETEAHQFNVMMDGQFVEVSE